MVSSLDIVVRGVYGLDKITIEHLVSITLMVHIWVIAFELEQEFNHLSHSRVMCDHVFIGFCIGSSLFCEWNFVW